MEPIILSQIAFIDSTRAAFTNCDTVVAVCTLKVSLWSTSKWRILENICFCRSGHFLQCQTTTTTTHLQFAIQILQGFWKDITNLIRDVRKYIIIFCTIHFSLSYLEVNYNVGTTTQENVKWTVILLVICIVLSYWLVVCWIVVLEHALILW